MSPFILVVDDEPAIREVLASFLSDEGYRIRTATNGREALDVVRFHAPDLVVSDVKMPVMHGLTLVERMRAEGIPTPVILVSTWTPPDGLLGVRYLPKPFDLDDVAAMVAQALAEAGPGGG